MDRVNIDCAAEFGEESQDDQTLLL